MHKYIAALLCLFALVACGNEDGIKPAIAYENAFVIEDNLQDSVEHERYLIYKEYGVPVYFNDTIQTKEKGKDAAGRPLIYHERVDLNWSFTGYDHGVKYVYKYLKTDAEKLRALKFVRAYLSKASKPMRPFSILLADTLSVVSVNNTDKPIYRVGFRTLVFAQIKDLASELDRNNTISTVIQSMIADRVKNNRDLTARFAEYGNKAGWYYREWKKLENTSNITANLQRTWTASVNVLYDEPPFSVYEGRDFVTVLTDAPFNMNFWEASEIRKAVLAEAANYGFLRGWKSSGSYTPGDADEDRNYYIQAMLHLGNEGFRRRYGAYPLVMEKYELLYNYISKDLGIDLEYDNLFEDW